MDWDTPTPTPTLERYRVLITILATSYTLLLGIVRSIVLSNADPKYKYTNAAIEKEDSDKNKDSSVGGFERVVYGDDVGQTRAPLSGVKQK